MASILLIETLVFGLYLMSDLVLLSEYDFDQDTFIALWNNCTFEEDHRKHHTSDCLGLKWRNISFHENTKHGLGKEEIFNK